MAFTFGPRRDTYVEITVATPGTSPLTAAELTHFEAFDQLYRSLCALLFNYVPTSGHPGGSISSGRFVAGILFDALDYDLSDPGRPDADLISYAAGHKAMGLYAMWALRDEVAAQAAPELLPRSLEARLRLEDLLGFRRNPTTATPLFRKYGARALDGHPAPATPFVKLSTGASGVGAASSFGLAFGAADRYGPAAPRVHVVEGEGGMTPGRVCRVGETPGDYAQWDPRELCYLHDWNVVDVPDGHDLRQVVAAQGHALTLENGQPTAIVYHTHKGWRYGVEGKASHGGGHKLCSEGFYQAIAELAGTADAEQLLPTCAPGQQRCAGPDGAAVREECFSAALQVIRARVAAERPMAEALTRRLAAARDRLEARERAPRPGAPRVDAAYELAADAAEIAPAPEATPEALRLEPGTFTTLRGGLGRALQHLQAASGGAFLAAAADLMGCTSVSTIAKGFPAGRVLERAHQP